MATEIGELKARLTAESQELKAEIKTVKKEITDLGEEGKKTGKQFDQMSAILSKIGENNTQLKQIESVLKTLDPSKLDKGLENIVEELRRIGQESKQIEKVGQELSGSSDAAKEATTDFKKTGDELKRLGMSSEEIDKVSKEFEKSAKGATGLEAEVKSIGVAYAALSAAMAVIIAKAIETSKTFEQSMANVKAITEATGEDFENLRENAIKLGSDTVFSASQAADAMSELGQAGFKTNEIVDAMPGMLSLAAAAQTDLATTADITSSALRGFGLGADQATRVADVLAKSAIDTNANVTDLGMAMKYVAPVAANMGISIEEAAAAIGELSNAGIKGENAGTSLRAILLQLASPSKEAASYMKQLGVSISDSAGNIKPLSTIIGDFQQAFTRLTQVQQADAAATIVGQEAASGFLTLISQGKTTLDNYSMSLQNAGGTAQQVADVQMNTLNGAINEMQSALESAGISVGDTFAPAIRGVAEEITKLLAGFNDLNPELRTMITVFMTVTPLVAGAAVAIIALKTAFDTMKAAAAAAGIQMTAFGASIPIIGAVAVAVGVLSAGIAGLAARNREAAESAKQFDEAQKKLNDTLNASPLSRSTADVEQMKTDMKTLQQLINNVREAEHDLAAEYAKPYDIQDSKARARRKDLRDALAEAQDALKSFGVDGMEEAVQTMTRYTDEINKSTPALIQMNKAEIADLATKNDQVTSMAKLSARYKELSAIQTLDASQKQELVDIANTLQKQYPELHAQLDKEGRLRIDNIDIVDGQINAEKSLLNTTLSAELERITTLEKTTEAQRKAVQAQIDNNISLIESIVAVNKAQAGSVLTSPDGLEDEKIYMQAQKRIKAANQQAAVLDSVLLDAQRARASLQGGNLDYFTGSSGSGINLTKGEKKEKSSSKSEKSPAEIAAELRKDAYDAAIATVQYQAEMYDWTADQQIKAYEKVRKQHQKHLKESIEDERQMNLQIKRLQEDSVKSRYDFSAEWIDREERRMEESGKTEIEIAQMKIDAWTRVRDRYAKDSEYYKKADEELYQVRKDLIKLQEDADKEAAKAREERIKEYEKQNDDLVKSELKAIEKAKHAELDAIDKRKQEYLDAQNEKIAAIDELLKKEEELNADADYETQLAEKKARQALLSTAVSPEGRKELADITAEIERMQLEHSRELRKRDLEDQKDKLEDEKDEKEKAYDEEQRLTEARYDALTDALEEHQDDIEYIESAIKEFRISSSEEANDQILSDLDQFVSEYRSRMAEITSLSSATSAGGSIGGGSSFSQAELDLAEYNANKDAWDAAKARGDKEAMARLSARNEEIRRMYGIEKDTGKLDRLPSYDVGGVIPGPAGTPVPIVAHGGEIYLNPEQQANLFRMLDAPRTPPADRSPVAPQQIIHNTFDMSVGMVEINDQTDAEIMYTERERAARRLATTGGK